MRLTELLAGKRGGDVGGGGGGGGGWGTQLRILCYINICICIGDSFITCPGGQDADGLLAGGRGGSVDATLYWYLHLHGRRILHIS